MTVKFRYCVALVTWFLLVFGGFQEQISANDGLAPHRYLGKLDQSAKSYNILRTPQSVCLNPLRPTELTGTIEGIENRKPSTIVSWPSAATLRPIYPMNATSLLRQSPSGAESTLKLTAETQLSARNCGRIVLNRPSAIQSVVIHFVDTAEQIRQMSDSFLSYCASLNDEQHRRLEIPAALAVQSMSIPTITAGFSRRSVAPFPPIRERATLKSVEGSNIRILMIESASCANLPIESLVEGWYPELNGAGEDGCNFFNECNQCFLGSHDFATPASNKDQKPFGGFNFDHIMNRTCEALHWLVDFGNQIPLIQPAEREVTTTRPPSENGTLVKSMLSVAGGMGQTIKRFAAPYLSVARTFDFWEQIPSIPHWIFLTVWPDNLGQNVSPFGIIY